MMTQGNRTKVWMAAGLALALAACSSSKASAPPSEVLSVTQDLDADPDGKTIVVRFNAKPGSVNGGNFRLESGTQVVQSVSKSGKSVSVVYDERVTPDYRLSVVGVGTVASDYRDIETTDSDAPTFTITNGTQDDSALGGDSFDVVFDGARVVADQAEDLDNWTLTVEGQELDLSGSTLDLDESTQTLSFTLGSQANLHSTFQLSATSVYSVADVRLATTAVSATATGDTAAPSLVSVEQNLAQDALGRVVDFTFDEPMDPVFAARPVNFAINDHADSSSTTTVTALTMPTDEVIRVTYSSPVVPGLDTVSLSGIVDSHGNALPSGTQAIANSNPAANGYESVTATTVEGELGDTIVVVTDQAFDPDLAVDPAYWTLTVGGGGVTMADQELSYSLADRELTIELDFDMTNGDAVVITAVNLPDVDGQTFSLADASASASGDSTEPSVLEVTQNRDLDASGQTLDVRLSEDVEETSAETIANWTLSGGLTVTAANLLGSLNIVRLTIDDVVVPGDYTLTAEIGLQDLAGNTLSAAQSAIAIGTTDGDAPSITSVSANAIEGADNDTIRVSFDDSMIDTEVEDDANWTVESPVGTALDVTGCTISYDSGARTATLTLDAGDLALKAGDDISVELADARDIGGNDITAGATAGAISAETTLPTADAAWRDATNTDQLVILFSEPCDELTDLYDAATNPTGTRFALRIGDGGANDGQLRGYPTAATALYGGLGVRLEYGFVIDATDKVDILGVTDLAGNYMFPLLAMPTSAEDTDAPALDGSSSITVSSGEYNDTIVIDFAKDMSPWNITSADHYTLETSAGAVDQDLTGATIEFDGAQTVTISLARGSSLNLSDSTDYDVIVDVDADNPLRTAQGVALGAQDSDGSVTASGDSVAPSVGASDARFHATSDDTILVIFDEAIDADVLDASDFSYNGTLADTVELISPRVVEVVFGAALTNGFSIDIATASISDLAGNVPGSAVSVAVTSDSTAPLISSVTATAVADAGGDTLEVVYNEEVDLDLALELANYSLEQGGNAVSLDGGGISWNSTTRTVRIALPAASDLDYSAGWTLTVSNIADVAGNAFSSTVAVSGAVAGDSTAPSIASSFVNLRENEDGEVLDVLFDEDVDTSWVGDAANWSTDGTAAVLSVEVVSSKHFRLTLDAALGASESVEITAVEDRAGNASGDLTSDPEE